MTMDHVHSSGKKRKRRESGDVGHDLPEVGLINLQMNTLRLSFISTFVQNATTWLWTIILFWNVILVGVGGTGSVTWEQREVYFHYMHNKSNRMTVSTAVWWLPHGTKIIVQNVIEISWFQENLGLLPQVARRYKRHFKLQTRPGLNKAQLAEFVQRHFSGMPVVEKEALAYFIYMVKMKKNRLDAKESGNSNGNSNDNNNSNTAQHSGDKKDSK